MDRNASQSDHRPIPVPSCSLSQAHSNSFGSLSSSPSSPAKSSRRPPSVRDQDDSESEACKPSFGSLRFRFFDRTSKSGWKFNTLFGGHWNGLCFLGAVLPSLLMPSFLQASSYGIFNGGCPPFVTVVYPFRSK
mmetsp:Transcript_41722/g.65146  ORF Transcript_41722/g.65146 Transcript_41722/m.65146 type:complete len:134 (+) Transcript_41722:231-632(+)